MKQKKLLVFAPLAFLLVASFSASARAQLTACGGIELTPSALCGVERGADCLARCAPYQAASGTAAAFDPFQTACANLINQSCASVCGGSGAGECSACENLARTSCETTLQNNCAFDCGLAGQGAIFCDGQYVDDGAHVDKNQYLDTLSHGDAGPPADDSTRQAECIAQIDAVVSTPVQGTAGSCSGDACGASGSVGCALVRLPASSSSNSGLGLLAAVALGLGLRRRR